MIDNLETEGFGDNADLGTNVTVAYNTDGFSAGLKAPAGVFVPSCGTADIKTAVLILDQIAVLI